MIVERTSKVQVIDGRGHADQRRPVRSRGLHVCSGTVNRINQLSARTQAQAIMGAATPVDDILEKPREWLDRLLSALTQIVAKLAGATAFSVTVGSAASVTVDFGPE